VIAVNRAARSVDKAFDARRPGGDQDMDEARDIARVRVQGTIDGPRHGAERCLVEDEVDVAGGPAAGPFVGQVGFKESEAPSRAGREEGANLIQITRMTGREVVQAHDLLPAAQQRFDEMRSMKPAAPVTSHVRGVPASACRSA
jgi:hypothetical protein